MSLPVPAAMMPSGTGRARAEVGAEVDHAVAADHGEDVDPVMRRRASRAWPAAVASSGPERSTTSCPAAART